MYAKAAWNFRLLFLKKNIQKAQKRKKYVAFFVEIIYYRDVK